MLVAPLNWGLGHATRCVPLIDALIKAGFEPVLGSDGVALEILKEAFPTLKAYELPGYNIKYSKSSWNFKLQLLFAFPRIRKVVHEEHELVQKIVAEEDVAGIISDNRFGVYSKMVPSVYLTHQLTVMSGIFIKLTTKLHQKIIEKFDECWVPDVHNQPNLSGKLSKSASIKVPVKYIGVLSRLQSEEMSFKYDCAIVLSGPEPQRTLLEAKILDDFSDTLGKTMLVRGLLSKEPLAHQFKNLEVVNYANKEQLSEIMNTSELIISRSGYSTIMDLAVLGKKAFFIPTPGQTEQEYLAEYVQELRMAPFVKQDSFSFDLLKNMSKYKGFSNQKVAIDLQLFSLFHGK